MPHKHKRKRDDDRSNFDLAPDKRAKPLAAYTKASLFTSDQDGPDRKRKKSSGSTKKSGDDTPKVFARLMSWQTTGKRPSGLDDGTSKPKAKAKSTQKRKATQSLQADPASTSIDDPSTSASATTATAATTKPTHPKILPGESLSEFSLRVDQTLPLTSLTNTSGKSNPALPADLQARLKTSQRTTKHNRRLQRMQSDWRATEAKLRSREAETLEDLADRRDEESLLWDSVRSHKSKKPHDDLWKDLTKKRREARQKNPRDVVTAPPTLKKVKSKFKSKDEDFEVLDQRGTGDALVDVANVPNAVGSLRRREEMNRARRAVIDGYREMHGRRRGVEERIGLARPVGS